MRAAKIVLMLWVLCLSCIASFGQGAKKPTATSASGADPYMPTKIEWAVLYMQANYGSQYSSESPMSVSFLADADDKTVVCIFQYQPDIPAQVMKLAEKSVRRGFNAFLYVKKWDWLKLRFDESEISTSN
jgi:hypothetical protein